MPGWLFASVCPPPERSHEACLAASARYRAAKPVLRLANPLSTATVLAACLLGGEVALAQSPPAERPESGLLLRDVSIATGYSFLKLPPVTLGGTVPSQVLENDLITSSEVGLGWNRAGRSSILSFDLSGIYTARAKYTNMNSAGGTVAFSASQTFGRGWEVLLGVSSSIFNSDQISFQPTHGQQLVNGATSVQDLSNRVGIAKSAHPDPTQAVLFVPINQWALANDSYGNRVFASVGKFGLTYTHSTAISAFVGANYSSAQRAGDSGEPGVALPFPDSQFYTVNAGVRYALTRATTVTAAVVRNESTGLYVNEATSATATFGWTGREWFTQIMAGLSVRPAAPPPSGVIVTNFSTTRAGLTYTANVGYKFRSQSLLAGVGRGLNDSQAYGSVQGDVYHMLASWYWGPLRSKWSAQANFTVYRTPGNFLYIYTWHGNTSIGRELRPNLRLMFEGIFDRHGSKAFEGFHMSTEGFRVNLIWLPRKRLV
jgi:hypothetical protein